MVIDHHDQQIVCFGTIAGTNQDKIEKSGFLRSVVNAIRCEANEINRWREERLIGSRAVKMLRDLRRRARGLARHVAAANARAEVRARMHNWSI